ncbi:MAG: hypothetical protein IPL95_06415 [Saprospiraceae bacterium]|nr:hypothetical protein [Saprospiraceae bacterium]
MADLSINYYSYRRFKCEYFKQEKCKVTIPEIINDSLLKKLDRNNDYDKNLLKDRKLLKSNSIERIIFEADSLFNNGNKELAASKINSLVDLNDQTPELIKMQLISWSPIKCIAKQRKSISIF